MAKVSYDGLVDKKVPLFDTKKFGKWLDAIKSECYLRPNAGKVLSNVLKDPATQFSQMYPAEYSRVPIEDRPASEEVIFEDPRKVLGKFLQSMLRVQPIPARPAVAAVPAANGQPAQPAIPAQDAVPGISIELKVQLRKEIEAWITGEQAIYALLTKSLINNKLKCEPEGTGRKQLRELENYWTARNAQTTLTLDDSFANFKYDKSEMHSLKEYANAFQELLDDCSQARPNPIVHNVEQILNGYIRGLKRVHMFEKHIDNAMTLGKLD